MYLFPGQRSDKPMIYKSHYESLAAVFAKCGIIASKVTHLFRGASARELHAWGYVSCCFNASMLCCTPISSE